MQYKNETQSPMKNGEYDEQSIDQQTNKNWYEVRLSGKVPERRGYHTSFVHNQK